MRPVRLLDRRRSTSTAKKAAACEPACRAPVSKYTVKANLVRLATRLVVTVMGRPVMEPRLNGAKRPAQPAVTVSSCQMARPASGRLSLQRAEA